MARGTWTICIGLLCALSLRAGAAPALEQRFDQELWNQHKSAWSGSTDQWSIQTHLTQTGLASEKPGSTLVTALPESDKGPLRLAIEYAFTNGRGRGSVEFRLDDSRSSQALILTANQRAGDKYQLALQDETGKKQTLGAIADRTLDLGIKNGGDLRGVRLEMTILPDGEMSLTRVGGSTTTQRLPAGFLPAKLTIADRSAGDENPRLIAIRAFNADRDPSIELQPLVLPLGASFVEGSSPRIALLARWLSDDARDVSVVLQLRSLLPEEKDLSAVKQTLTVKSSQPSWLSLPEWQSLAPGLYEVQGQLTSAAQKRAVRARFAILSAELAGRPTTRIPQWVGMMPYLNLLPRERYAETFEFMEQMGVRHLRWLPGWGRIEMEKDQYDWSESDQFVDLCEKHHMTAMFCLSYFGADWTTKATDGKLARTEDGRTMWVDRFAVPAIKRYGDRVKMWQIWNEPDAFWNDDIEKAKGFATAFGTPANYFDLLQRTYNAAHALGIPDVRIMASLSSADQPGNIKRLFAMGLGKIFDGLIVHTYGNHQQHFIRDKKQLGGFGIHDAAIGSGEIGIPTPPTPAGERLQAARVASVYLSTTSVSNVLCVDWFVLTRVAHPMFGLIDQNLQPQAGVLAFHTVAHLLAGATTGSTKEIGDVRVQRVERDGQTPLVAAIASQQTSMRFKVRGGTPPVVWDLWGHKRSPKVEKDRFELMVDDVVLIEGDVELDTMLVATIEPSIRDGKHVVKVNPTGQFSADAPATLKLNVPALGVSIERQFASAAALKQGWIEIPGATLTQSYDCTVDLSIGEQSLAMTAPIEFTPSVHVTQDQASSLTPPTGATKISIGGDKFFQSLGHGRYGGLKDNSADLYFGWSDTDLILWINQTDDVNTPVQMPNPWGFDGPQWAISAQGPQPGASFIEITFGLAKDGLFAKVMGQPHYSPTLKADRSGTTTRYRVSIPFSQLDVEPAPGRSISTSLVLNDNDNDGTGRKGWIGFGQGVGEEKNPAKFRTITLTQRGSMGSVRGEAAAESVDVKR